MKQRNFLSYAAPMGLLAFCWLTMGTRTGYRYEFMVTYGFPFGWYIPSQISSGSFTLEWGPMAVDLLVYLGIAQAVFTVGLAHCPPLAVRARHAVSSLLWVCAVASIGASILVFSHDPVLVWRQSDTYFKENSRQNRFIALGLQPRSDPQEAPEDELKVLRSMKVEDGIDAQDAAVMARAFCRLYFGSDAEIALPSDYGKDWLVSVSLGKRITLLEPIKINKATGHIGMDGIGQAGLQDLTKVLVLPYSDFGPQAAAYSLIGMEWYQWNTQGPDNPKAADPVRVVVYRDMSLDQARKMFPTIREKQDYRYVAYDDALRYLTRYENGPLLSGLKNTKKKLLIALGDQTWRETGAAIAGVKDYGNRQ